jgi:hypothetical protein
LKRALFVCGTLHTTSQMHHIARELPEYSHAFSPYWGDTPALRVLRRLGALETSILGERAWARCLSYLHARRLPVDIEGREGPYDLVVTTHDAVVQRSILGSKIVLVQEGMTDPLVWTYHVWRAMRGVVPRYVTATAATGLSDAYDRFCVASQGYKDLFVSRGARAEKLVVTGVPNLDDCRRYARNDFPMRGYVLVCTTDTRETMKRDDRAAFIRRAVAIAAGRPLVFKLHPNEDAARSRAEIARWAPTARVFEQGKAEEMVANCDVLVTQWSTLAYVGLALGKEVHSAFDIDELRRLLPVQNCCAARLIADVCRDLVPPGAEDSALRAMSTGAPKPAAGAHAH